MTERGSDEHAATHATEPPETSPADESQRWLNPGVGGIGLASFLADVGHEVPTALLPGFVTQTLGAPAAALGLVEGVSEGLAGAGRFVVGCLSPSCCSASLARSDAVRGPALPSFVVAERVP